MISPEEYDKVKILLASSGWNDVMRPAIAKRGQNAVRALVLHSSERKGEEASVSDDVLRARIQECEWMLAVWSNEVVAFEQNRRLDELDSPATNGGEPARR
jgi:hypothetical protein